MKRIMKNFLKRDIVYGIVLRSFRKVSKKIP